MDGDINVHMCDGEDLDLLDDESIDNGDKSSDRTRNKSVAPGGNHGDRSPQGHAVEK
jgi:hypothetical protein